MDLYVFPPSPNCLKVIALAHHLKLPVTLKPVYLPRGEHKAREFLELNPNGRVPLLIDGALKLWESNAIMYYMAERSHGLMLPPNAAERADMLRWMFWQTAHFGPACGTLIFERFAKKLLGMGEPDAQEIERGEKAVVPLLQILDAHLDEQTYVCGNHLTIADFAIAAFGVYRREAGIPMDEHPNIMNWYERIDTLPAWQMALRESRM